jgi:hypothetical protein
MILLLRIGRKPNGKVTILRPGNMRLADWILLVKAQAQ